jgi:hypothetical protein
MGSAMQGPRPRSIGHSSLASGASGARLRRRAPGVGISAGAAKGGSRVVGSIDAMLHGTMR